MSGTQAEFANELTRVFPECASKAVEFYETIGRVAKAWLRALARVPDLYTAGRVKTIRALVLETSVIRQLLRLKNKTAQECLQDTSPRFQRFIDAQLRAFARTAIEQCPYLPASIALSLPRQKLYSILGGPATVAERLAESIARAGGTIRLNSPVLRLAYDTSGRAAGVDLLSGETVLAKSAIVSNMTVWDTYGKLIGLNRTPPEVKKKLAGVRGTGAYLIYAGIEEAAAQRLPAGHLLVVNELPQQVEDQELSEFTFAATPANDSRCPSGKRAVTLQTATDVEQWFTYQANEEEHEQRDQEMLEAFWTRVHRALPELGGDIEVIETANPRTFYDQTRRKLGMVGGAVLTMDSFGPNAIGHQTSLPNVFLVGDTVVPVGGLSGVANSALIVANEITK
jgi:phytoene dehydrogenase-like protein